MLEYHIFLIWDFKGDVKELDVHNVWEFKWFLGIVIHVPRHDSITEIVVPIGLWHESQLHNPKVGSIISNDVDGWRLGNEIDSDAGPNDEPRSIALVNLQHLDDSTRLSFPSPEQIRIPPCLLPSRFSCHYISPRAVLPSSSSTHTALPRLDYARAYWPYGRSENTVVQLSYQLDGELLLRRRREGPRRRVREEGQGRREQRWEQRVRPRSAEQWVAAAAEGSTVCCGTRRA